MRLVARGLANKEIAEELAMSPSTVRVHVHVTEPFKTLGVENRTQAAPSEAAQGARRGRFAELIPGRALRASPSTR